MMDYTKIVTGLRECARDNADCRENCPYYYHEGCGDHLKRDAADAIEELQNQGGRKDINMSKYRIEMRTPSGMWIPAVYPDFVRPPLVDSREQADRTVRVLEGFWNDVWIEKPTGYRIVKEEVSHE